MTLDFSTSTDFSAFTQHQTFQYRTFSTDSYSSDSSAYFMFHLCMPYYITSLIEFILNEHHALFIEPYVHHCMCNSFTLKKIETKLQRT